MNVTSVVLGLWQVHFREPISKKGALSVYGISFWSKLVMVKTVGAAKLKKKQKLHAEWV